MNGKIYLPPSTQTHAHAHAFAHRYLYPDQISGCYLCPTEMIITEMLANHGLKARLLYKGICIL